MLLLDTHAILWLDSGEPLAGPALAAIEGAAQAGGVLVSPVSAWEIGLLTGKGRIRLDLDPIAWFTRFLGLAGVRLTPLTIEAAIGSSFLPEPFYGDPADRMLVATARYLGVPVVTRDRRMLEYAATGSVQAIAC